MFARATSIRGKAAVLSMLAAVLVMSSTALAVTYPGATWGVKTSQADAETVGVDASKMATNFNALAAMPGKYIGNVVVIKDGYIVYQRENISSPTGLWSVSKSVTSLIAGRLMQTTAGTANPLTLNTPIAGSNIIMSNPQPDTGAILTNQPGTYLNRPAATLRQFMSMTSEFNHDDINPATGSPYSPGQRYAYNNNAVDYYGQKLAETYFQTTPALGKYELAERALDTAIFSQIGRQNPIDFFGQYGGWDMGWAISAQDMARIGWLVLNNGQWNGQQVIHPDYMAGLATSQIPSSAIPSYEHGPDDRNNQEGATAGMGGAYSYGWWLMDAGGYAQKFDEPTGVFYGTGYMSKKLLVDRENNMVIVSLGDYPSAADHDLFLTAARDALVPEPATATILALAGAGLLGRRRRRDSTRR